MSWHEVGCMHCCILELEIRSSHSIAEMGGKKVEYWALIVLNSGIDVVWMGALHSIAEIGGKGGNWVMLGLNMI